MVDRCTGLSPARAAYRHGDAWLDELIPYLDENARFFRAYLQENLPKIKAFPLEGTYLQWVDFRALKLSDEGLEALLRDRAGLWVSQGNIFGKEGGGFARFNLATQRENLKDALTRLRGAIQSI